jgi:hypothetical protein
MCCRMDWQAGRFYQMEFPRDAGKARHLRKQAERNPNTVRSPAVAAPDCCSSLFTVHTAAICSLRSHALCIPLAVVLLKKLSHACPATALHRVPLLRHFAFVIGSVGHLQRDPGLLPNNHPHPESHLILQLSPAPSILSLSLPPVCRYCDSHQRTNELEGSHEERHSGKCCAWGPQIAPALADVVCTGASNHQAEVQSCRLTTLCGRCASRQHPAQQSNLS